MLGSEGIFGIVTEATIRLHPLPSVSHYCGYLFRDFASGVAAIREAYVGVEVARAALPGLEHSVAAA